MEGFISRDYDSPIPLGFSAVATPTSGPEVTHPRGSLVSAEISRDWGHLQD